MRARVRVKGERQGEGQGEGQGESRAGVQMPAEPWLRVSGRDAAIWMREYTCMHASSACMHASIVCMHASCVCMHGYGCMAMHPCTSA